MPDFPSLQLALQALNFTEKEALVYLQLLELDETIPSVIAKKAGMKRPSVYLTLDHLLKRGLITNVKKKNILYYRAIKPEIFIEREKKRIENDQTQLQFLEKSLPELLSLHQKFTATPQMSVFYGKEGLIQIMEDTLSTKEDLLCWADVELAVSSLKDYYPTYVKKKVARKIWVRGICCYDEIAGKFQKKGLKELREIYLISKEEFPFKNEINIYDDKVAILSHKDQIGVIIQNQNIADTQKAIFKLAFGLLKTSNLEVISPKGF